MTLLRDRIGSLEDTEPLSFRHKNGGDFDEDLVLRSELAPGSTGPGVYNAH